MAYFSTSIAGQKTELRRGPANFTPAEASAWLKAGLQIDDEGTAALLRREGVQPHHMALVIRRQTVLDRFQIQRLSARQIAGLLRREGKLAA